MYIFFFTCYQPKISLLLTILYKTLQYFSKLYNTLQCTIRIEIHYLSQDVPAVAACISTPGLLQSKYRVLVVSRKKNARLPIG